MKRLPVLQPGDVVVALDDEPVLDAAQLPNRLAVAEVDSRLRLRIIREGRRLELTVPVEEAQPNG